MKGREDGRFGCERRLLALLQSAARFDDRDVSSPRVALAPLVSPGANVLPPFRRLMQLKAKTRGWKTAEKGLVNSSSAVFEWRSGH